MPVGSSLLRSFESGDDDPRAVVVAGEATSRADLLARADALARSLVAAPAAAIAGTATLDTVIGVVAGLRAGVPVVPVPADSGPIERAHLLGDSGASVVIGEPEWPDVDLPRLPVPEVATGAGPLGLDEPESDQPALIMYTSGTTGLPKGVVISRRAIAAGLDGLADAWSWTPDDVLVHGLPLFHVHGLILGVLGPLRIGSRLVHSGRPTPDAYATAARRGGTMFFGVPTVWSRIAAAPTAARALTTARLLISGSAALPVPVFDDLESLTGQRPVERYGMTETLITLSTRADGERRPGQVGRPIAGVETRLRLDEDPDIEVARDGESIGGLQVRGMTLFDGYLNRPDATAASMTDDGWFVTGDAVSIDSDGGHRIVGRTSIDIIKTGGYKVGAGEIETVLLAHPDVTEAAVVGIPDDDLGQRVVAFVVGDARPEVLIDHVAAQLAVHKRPRVVHVVDALPRNAMGKVQKQQLR